MAEEITPRTYTLTDANGRVTRFRAGDGPLPEGAVLEEEGDEAPSPRTKPTSKKSRRKPAETVDASGPAETTGGTDAPNES